MLLYTNMLQRPDIEAAAARALVALVRCNQRGARKAARCFDVVISGTAPRASASREHLRAATWDEYGTFFSLLYDREPTLLVNTIYVSREHFDWSTDYRFQTPGQRVRCAGAEDHEFQFLLHSEKGHYSMSKCAHCPAVRRWAKDPVAVGFAS